MSVEAGHSVQIISIDEESGSKFLLDEEALSSILLRPEARDRKVVMVSIAGAFRQGKSFLLDFFLRYLSSGGSENWLGQGDEPLKGFPWRGGSERDTTGILLWSEPFLVTLPSGEKVAVLLMDTQGSFDSMSTVRQCATVFALSTMLSSIQVYNIHGNIQEDHLQHLHLFTDYGRLAIESNYSGPPFQHLLFLIRDWSFPYEYPFGQEGGRILLETRLKVLPEHRPEHQTLRRHIRSCFSKVSGFLMPHPGLLVATSPKFDGRLSEVDSGFLEQLHSLVSSLLSPANLVVKEINREQLTCRDLIAYFKTYTEIYQSDELPEPRSMLEATAEANNLNAMIRSQEFYTEEMNKICGPDKPYIHSGEVENSHNRLYEEAVTRFLSVRKLGGEEYSQSYLDRLKSTLVHLGDEYRVANNHKNVFQTFRTPIILVGLVLVCHILMGISEFLGLSMITTLVLFPFYLGIFVLSTWVFVNYTGRAPELGHSIDSSTDFFFCKVINPAVKHIGQRGLERVTNTQTIVASN